MSLKQGTRLEEPKLVQVLDILLRFQFEWTEGLRFSPRGQAAFQAMDFPLNREKGNAQ